MTSGLLFLMAVSEEAVATKMIVLHGPSGLRFQEVGSVGADLAS